MTYMIHDILSEFGFTKITYRKPVDFIETLDIIFHTYNYSERYIRCKNNIIIEIIIGFEDSNCTLVNIKGIAKYNDFYCQFCEHLIPIRHINNVLSVLIKQSEQTIYKFIQNNKNI